MAEIKLKFDLSFSRRFVTACGTLAIMLCAVPELDSESVTLSTYYPAPSGVYTNMITTGRTYLARDGTAVSVGSTALPAGLEAYGYATFRSSVAGSYGLTPGYANWSAYGTGAGGAGIYNDGSTNQALMIVGNNSAGGARRVKVSDELSVTGDTNTAGVLQSRQGASGACDAAATYAYPTPGGGTQVLCPGGKYITSIEGLYVKRYLIPVTPNASTNPEVTYVCCNCPLAGCAL